MPAPLLTKPIVKPMPLPVQLAQNNADVMRRLDQLEEENRRLREQMQQRQDGPAPRGGLPSTPLPRQSASGWWVHLYPYNPDGDIKGEPSATYRYDTQKFNATIGFKTDNALDWSQLFLYKYEAWFVVQKEGTYQLGAEVECPWAHPCNFSMRIDEIEILSIKRKTIDKQILFASRSLTPGNYRVEILFGLANTNYVKFKPNLTTMHPKVRTPADMNFRDFRADELVVQDRRDVPMGPPMQWPSGWQ